MSLLADAQDFVRMEREVPTGVSLALSDGRVGVGGGIRSINRTTKGLPPPRPVGLPPGIQVPRLNFLSSI